MMHRAHLAAALGLLLCTASCTLLVDRSADQCETDADCAAFPGTACSAEGLCAAPPCATNQDCTGDHEICREPDKVCARLLSDQCLTVEGDYTNDEAFLVGAVLPTSEATGMAIESAIRLAIRDFQQAANGLPPAPGGSSQRPLVLVSCNDMSDADTAVLAAEHLADLGVPAIIGAAYSGITIKMATEVTIPAGVLAISPSATSVAITNLPDSGLVWRTSPSDVFQAQAMAQYVPTIEQRMRDLGELLPGEDVRVVVLNKGDAYGSGLGTAVEKDLIINGAQALDPSNASNYLRFDYGNPDNPAENPTKYPEAVAAVVGELPHIVLLLGTNELVTELLLAIEAAWPPPMQAPYRPRYVISDGGVINALWESVGTNDALRVRVTGTVPGTANILFNAFKSAYISQFPGAPSPDIFGAAGGYDATYLLAYAAVTLGGEAVTGAGLAAGLTRMVPPGTPVDVGTTAINGTFTSLAEGEAIDFNGASGPLDFDVATGEAPSDIQIWCMPRDGNGAAQSAIGSGLYLNATTGQLEGAFGAICN